MKKNQPKEIIEKPKTLQDVKNDIFYEYQKKCLDILGDKMFNKTKLQFLDFYQEMWKTIKNFVENKEDM